MSISLSSQTLNCTDRIQARPRLHAGPAQVDDIYPAWKWIDLTERHGQIDSAEAQRWTHGIFGLMERWGWGAEKRQEVLHRAGSIP